MLALAPVAGMLLAAAPAAAQWAPSPYYPAAGYPVQQAYYAPYGAPPYNPEGALAGYNAPLMVYDPQVMPAGLLRGGCSGCGGQGCDACGGGAGAGLLQGRGGAGMIGPSMGPLGPGLGMGTPGGIGTNNGQGIWTKHGPLGCATCGGAGCDACAGGIGGLDGECAGCCTPRWWDIQAEFLYMTREEVSRRVDFTSQGVGPANIVLSTDNLDFDHEPGFRVSGALLLGPGTNLEGSYLGTFEWDASAAATGPGDLFSALSGFGLVATDPDLPEVNNSNLQSLDYSSELHSWEVSVRRRWVSPNCRFHTSWLAGARYLVLNEDLRYFINREDPVGAANRVVGTVDYNVDTFNDLIGFQTGGDFLLCVIPRVKVGGNIKAGVYGVEGEQVTTIIVTRFNGPPPIGDQIFPEQTQDQDVAFVGEGGFEYIIEATERLTLRGGYQLLYIDGVALAPENFNPAFNIANRDVTVNHNGSVFLHGFQAGFEFTW
jgi:hypothetical protein